MYNFSRCFKKTFSCLFLGAALLTSFDAAASCLIEQGPFGNWRPADDCAELPEAFVAVPTSGLQLPDLEPNRLRVQVQLENPDLVGFLLDVENLGNVDAAEFDVMIDVTVYRFDRQVNSARWAKRWPGVPAGNTLREHGGFLNHTFREGDLIEVTARVDSRHFFAGGEIWEANERNNVFQDSCVVTTDDCR